MEEYILNEQFVENILKQSSRSLVGKACKRFEIIEDREILKNELKELIYEHYRDLKSSLKCFSIGIKFVSPKK